jgi:membrane protease YdiL (CAAX protease family)
VTWALLIGVVTFAVGRVAPAEAGLDPSRLRDGAAILIGLWLLTQAACAAAGAASGSIGLDDTLPVPGRPAAALGVRLQAILGTGLLEEVIYRGFLQTQLFLVARRHLSRDAALGVAIAAASLYFGINHVPAGLRMGLDAAGVAGYVLQCSLAGALFGTLYVRTGNLFVAAAAHALLNDPAAVLASPIDPSLFVMVAACGLLLAWPWLSRRVGGVFSYATLEGRLAL